VGTVIEIGDILFAKIEDVVAEKTAAVAGGKKK
jgi:hypothetical protein